MLSLLLLHFFTHELPITTRRICSKAHKDNDLHSSYHCLTVDTTPAGASPSAQSGVSTRASERASTSL